MYEGSRRESGAGSTTNNAGVGVPGKQTLVGQIVQRHAQIGGEAVATDDARVHELAVEGTQGGGGALPYADQIQRSFGAHDVSHVQAHVGGAATAAAEGMGAQAFATGDRVAFAGAPDLHTAAHEAAHVVQQRAGVHLAGGVGAEGDAYEQHADAVADRVVAGESAVDLLDAASGGGGGGAPVQRAVQRKAVVGDDMRAPTAQEANDAKSQALVADDTVRRFKDVAEMKSFAAAGRLDGMGNMPDGTWVRVDAPPMLVLGENHGDPIAPNLINATGIKNYRYEGFAHHSETRKGKSSAIDETLDTLTEERSERTGLQVGDDDPTHDAEHALPKYARTLADMIELVRRQGNGGAEVAGKSTAAGADLTADYSLAKALIDGTWAALVYAQSYGKKFFKHAVKTAYNAHAAEIDNAIVLLTARKGDDATKHQVPDFAAMGLTIELLTELHAAFRMKAQEKVGLDSAAKRDAWKAKLDTRKEPKVAMTDEAQEDDYLRDKSMFDTIKKAKDGGDRLFVIGDAHRTKLANLITGAGAQQMKDTEYLAEQKQLHLRAAVGRAGMDQLSAAKRTVEGRGFKMPGQTPIGDTVTVPMVAGCTWEVEGAHAAGPPGEYVIDGQATFNLAWSGAGQRVEIKSWTVYAAPARAKAADKPVAQSGGGSGGSDTPVAVTTT